MAWPVNAVEITASAMIAGTKVAARLPPNDPSGSNVNPISNVIGMNMVSSSCSPLRSNSFSSRSNCAASILGTAAACGLGVKVPAGNCGWVICAAPRRQRASRAQLPAGQLEEDVLQAALFYPQVGGQHVD